GEVTNEVCFWPVSSASMRPRPKDRGETEGLQKSITDADELQCGHGPKTVGKSKTLPDCQANCKLQCGHGPKTVGNSWFLLLLSHPSRASMRPRPKDRGEAL